MTTVRLPFIPAAVAAALLVTPLASCGWITPGSDGLRPGTGTSQPVIAVSLSVSPRDTSLAVGGVLQFVAMVRDPTGKPLTSNQLRWISRDPSRLQVDSLGVATAMAAGPARVVATLGVLADSASALVTTPGPAPDFTVTVNRTSQNRISRFVYGMNLTTEADGAPANAFPWYGANPPRGVTFDRYGGNRYSAYNWETNFSNAGADYQQQNDDFLSQSRTPAEAVTSRVTASRRRGAATLVTVPMLGYVAADGNGPMETRDATLQARLAQRFRVSRSLKGSAFSLRPNVNDGEVYQDEFVNAIAAAFPGAVAETQTPLMFTLDNEPDSWHAQFKSILPDSADDPNRARLQTYTQFLATTMAYANAVKSVAPNATVFGGSFATWAGVLTMGRYPKPDPVYGSDSFVEYYLRTLAAAERSTGRRLVDVLDLHWYPATGTNAGEITNDYAPQSAAMIAKRLQAPRSLWDPTFNEDSWVSDVTNGPIALIPRLRTLIDRLAPGLKLAITEYYYGRAGDISGGIAQADVLGIFGREGLYAAAFWPQAGVYAEPWVGRGERAYAYAFGAFQSYLDYDGKGSRFGDIGLATVTSKPALSSAYGSLDAQGRTVLVVINKETSERNAELVIAPATTDRNADVYVMRDGVPTPTFLRRYAVSNSRVTVSLPPLSVSTIVLSP
jgi:hypothetical protein